MPLQSCSFVELSGLLGYDAVSSAAWSPTFQGKVYVFTVKGQQSPVFLETSVVTHPKTHRCIAEDLNRQNQRCEIRKFCYFVMYISSL